MPTGSPWPQTPAGIGSRGSKCLRPGGIVSEDWSAAHDPRAKASLRGRAQRSAPRPGAWPWSGAKPQRLHPPAWAMTASDVQSLSAGATQEHGVGVCRHPPRPPTPASLGEDPRPGPAARPHAGACPQFVAEFPSPSLTTAPSPSPTEVVHLRPRELGTDPVDSSRTHRVHGPVQPAGPRQQVGRGGPDPRPRPRPAGAQLRSFPRQQQAGAGTMVTVGVDVAGADRGRRVDILAACRAIRHHHHSGRTWCMCPDATAEPGAGPRTPASRCLQGSGP